MTTTERLVRSSIRTALLAKDMEGHTRALIGALAYYPVNEIERLARDELDRLPHELQMWWQGECNCDGHLN